MRDQNNEAIHQTEALQPDEIRALKEEYNSHAMSEEQVLALKKRMAQAKSDRHRARRRAAIKGFAAAAACAAIFVALPNTSMGLAHAMSQIPLFGRLVEVVTFRDYTYEDDRNSAQIQVPELIVGTMGEDAEGDTQSQQSSEEKLTVADDGKEVGTEGQEKLKRTVEEINAQIQEITDRMIQEFEENRKAEWSYQDIIVKSELLGVTDDYFTLKLFCYQGAGSGTQWNYFYTVDLNTGERLSLTDLFQDGADYITLVSEDIKRQMREQMAQDEMKKYWLDDPKHSYWEFSGITEETAFYLNDDGALVICFDEGDVAPMYMGSVEFVIDTDAIKDIRR